MAADTKRPNLQTDIARRHSLHREVERSRCAGRTIKGVRERLEFQTPGYDKYPF
jgi:hypothetical protein